MCVYASAVKKKIEVESDVFLNMLSHHVVDIYSTTILYMYYIIIISSISTYIRVCIDCVCVTQDVKKHVRNNNYYRPAITLLS